MPGAHHQHQFVELIHNARASYFFQSEYVVETFRSIESHLISINLKTAVEYTPANKNQHKLDKENCVM